MNTSGDDFADINRLRREEFTRIRDARLLETKTYLDENHIVYREISGGVVIVSPHNAEKTYYFYPYSRKWRNTGKRKYYYAKNIRDLVERFILQ